MRENHGSAAFCMNHPGDEACNPGMCPDRESNRDLLAHSARPPMPSSVLPSVALAQEPGAEFRCCRGDQASLALLLGLTPPPPRPVPRTGGYSESAMFEGLTVTPRVTGQLLMDPISLQLGTKNQWGWLVSLLSSDPEWLSAKVKFFLPNIDLGSRDEDPDPRQRVLLQLRELHTHGLATWQAFIHCVCMELEVPLELEVQLLSTWGHGDAELAKRYLQQLRTSAQQRYGGELPGPGQPLAFHQTYVPPILQWSRATAPFSTQEGAVPGSPRAEDADLSLQDLFGPRADKGPRVMVLLGKAGMGKTTLTRWLCQKWADGQLDRFQALFLFEFRQLNLLAEAPTLPQLLFDLYLRPEEGPDAVLQYLERNAKGVLLIFDGLEEVLHPHPSGEAAGPEAPGPALALFSGLCRGTLLPGCRVMATSRPGKLPDCLPTEAATIHLWGFDGPRVEEYAGRFFSNQPAREAALAELRANRHLRGMCAVPALCRIACLCLRHLLPDLPLGQSAALLPTVTQNYVQMVLALSPRGHRTDEALRGLGEVALRGLETGKVIFSAGDIPPAMMAFGAALGLLTSFCVCTGPRQQEPGYAFTHLSLQEFLAALHLMASPEVDRDALARHVTLNSRWLLRTKARLGLWDHLPIFLAGLASSACSPFLRRLAERGEAWVGAKQAAVIQALKKLATRKLTGPKVVELCRCVDETQEPELAGLMARSLPDQLPFHNFPLTYADLAALTSVLGHREVPIHLDFEGCPLEPRCPEALAGCGRVESLRLAGSKITARGIYHLVQALPLCPHLEEVSLSHNHVSMATLLGLTEAAVTCPTIRMLQVREADLIILLSPPTETAAELPGLQKCCLTVRDVEMLIAQLREGPLLEEVDLSGNQLEDEGCRLVAEAAPQLHIAGKLDLSDNGLSVAGLPWVLRAVSMCQNLADLHISRFTDCGLSQMHVEPLCELLRKCEDLSQLDLSGNSISQEGALCLVETLPSCPRIREAAVNLGAEQSFRIHFSRQEEAGKTLRLRECSFRPEHVPRLAAGLSQAWHLTELTLSRCCLDLQPLTLLLRLLRRPEGLLRLRVEEPWMGRAGVLTLLHVCAQASGNVTEISISESQQQLCLQLKFPRQENPEAVARRLARCNLETHHSLLDGKLMEMCTWLRQLSLSQVTLCHASCQLLQSSLLPLSELKTFRLASSCVSSGGLAPLASGLSRCRHLEELDLSNNQLGEEASTVLAGALKGRSWLRRLDLSHFPLDDSTLAVLAQGLSHMTRLQSLCLSGDDIGDVGCSCLAKALEAATSLEELGLSHNQIGDAGAQHLAAVLPGLPELRRVDLSANGICPAGGVRLVESLALCKHLEELILSANGICPAGGVRLVESLALCKHLEELMLGCNALGDPTALELARALPPHLRVLHLRSSRLGPEGALSLGRALDGCPHLEEISLVSCEIDDQAAKLLAASFMLCPALEEILLSWNLLGDEAAAELAQVLPRMQRLKSVDLWNNHVPPDAAQRLQSQEPRLDFSFFPNERQAPRGT
ncbi:Protein NLRC5 [Myotis davidii]|uniref:Protein NLRC5 n=1 Tax=Myotis davidii TaxID=225400 RepID=L5MIF8_MYODS|nr:Protein NLRC5 [Myotis davidii]